MRAGEHYTLFMQNWKLSGSGDNYTGNVVPGKTYFYSAYIEPDEGYTIGEVGTRVPVYLNGTQIGEGISTRPQ